MRALFGLVGVLITVGVIVWFLGPGGGLSHTQNVIKIGDRAKEQAAQVAGQDTVTGDRASASISLEPLNENGKLSGMLVSRLRPGGAFERYFGLKKNDTIIALEYQGNRQTMKEINDSEMADAQVQETYQRKGTLTIVRDEKELTLPMEASAKNSNQTTGSGNGSKDETQQQIDVLQGIPGGGVR